MKLYGAHLAVVTCDHHGDVYEFPTGRQAEKFVADHYGSWTVSTREARAVVWQYVVTYHYESYQDNGTRVGVEESGLYASQTACRSAMRTRIAEDEEMMQKRGHGVASSTGIDITGPIVGVEHEMRALEVQ